MGGRDHSEPKEEEEKKMCATTSNGLKRAFVNMHLFFFSLKMSLRGDFIILSYEPMWKMAALIKQHDWLWPVCPKAAGARENRPS